MLALALGAAPPGALEVVGGPEDGRRIHLEPGQTLGRWHSSGEHPDVALFMEQGCTDLRISKVHLKWMGPGLVTIIRSALHTRRGQTGDVPAGALQLADGDGKAPYSGSVRQEAFVRDL